MHPVIGGARSTSFSEAALKKQVSVGLSILTRLRGAAWTLVLMGLLALSPAAQAAASTGPGSAAVKAANDSIRAALKKMVAARGTPGWSAARTQAREAVAGLIDFESFAQGTLGAHWSEITPAQRTRFVDAIRSAMEGSYLNRMQGKVAVDEAKVDYLGEETDAKSGHLLVHTHVTYGQDGVKLDFLMGAAAKGKKLRAIDVITDEVSLAETYRETITSNWAKKGIDGLSEAYEKKARRFEADLEAAQGDGKSTSTAPAGGKAAAATAP